MFHYCPLVGFLVRSQIRTVVLMEIIWHFRSWLEQWARWRSENVVFVLLIQFFFEIKISIIVSRNLLACKALDQSHKHTHVHASTHTDAYTNTRESLHTYTYAHEFIYARMTYNLLTCTHTNMYTNTHMHTNAYTHTRDTNTYRHIYTHTLRNYL